MLAFTFFRTDAYSASPPKSVTPLYRIDLRSVFNSNAVPQLGTRETPWVPVITLNFLDNSRLVSTFVVPARGRPSLETRGEPKESSPFRIRAAVIEASTGRVLATPEWHSNSRAAGIATVNDKGLVVLAGAELTLLSPDLRLVKRLALAPASETNMHNGYWTPHASWSGSHVLLLGRERDRSEWVWLDGENLAILRSWRGNGIVVALAASDHQVVAGTTSSTLGNPPPVLEIGAPGGGWTPIPSTANPFGARFVGPGLLYFHQYATIGHPDVGGAFLMRTDSGEVSRLEPPRNKNWGLGQAAVSRRGRRFVILVEQTKGAHPALDIGGHDILRALVVFEPPFTAPSLMLHVQKSRLRNPDLVALSPDGHHLAVMGYPKPAVEVYELPPPK